MRARVKGMLTFRCMEVGSRNDTHGRVKDDHKSVCQQTQTRQITLRWKSCGWVKLSQTPDCIPVPAGIKVDVAKGRLLIQQITWTVTLRAVYVPSTHAVSCEPAEIEHIQPNL